MKIMEPDSSEYRCGDMRYTQVGEVVGGCVCVCVCVCVRGGGGGVMSGW